MKFENNLVILVDSDLIIFCTPTSEYKKLILKINSFILPKTVITDIGSSKIESSKIIKKFLKKGIHWTRSHPIAGSEVSGPEFGNKDLFKDKWCIILKNNGKSKKNLKKIIKFWKKLGSKIIFMKPFFLTYLALFLFATCLHANVLTC